MKLALILSLLCSLLLISACSISLKKAPKIKVEKPSQSSFLEAAKQPIYSTNLIRKKTPEHLKGITQSYQAPHSCGEYAEELILLNEALGVDPIDKASNDNEVVTLHFGRMISSQVESSIPFNSLIKTLSGAKKHERKMLAARLKGNARRSYLKGWAAAQNCVQK